LAAVSLTTSPYLEDFDGLIAGGDVRYVRRSITTVWRHRLGRRPVGRQQLDGDVAGDLERWLVKSK
jgi:hypothetical protein